MKKITLLFLTQVMVVCLFAQQTVYLTEGFSSVPPSGWTIDAQSAHWSSSASANAGGTSPECDFNWSPQFTGVSRLISPQVNTTGASSVVLDFQYMLDHYGGAYTIGAATTSNGSTWTDVWSIVNPSASVSATNEVVQITNADVGSSTFQICFYFSGDSYNINDWYIDDVFLFEPCTTDGNMAACTVPSYVQQGSINITGDIVNYGTGNITSMIVKYQIDNGTINTTNITGINLSFGQTYSYTCTQPWSATPGNYSLKVWIDDVNSAGLDCNQDNDTITKAVSIATQTATRLPIYEEFTSSTCSPCASFNSGTFTPFITAHPDEFSLIKYQMNWPGNGDPYYTAEGGTRRTYYGVNAVPDLFIDGASSAMTSSGMAAELTAEAGKATFFTIAQTPTYTGTTVTVPITITPYISGTFKVYVVVVEKTTTGNVSTNGETSFKHVMMKMLGSANGTSVSFTAGTDYTNSFVQDMSATNVEEMSDLQAVVFVQENATKEIFQSSFDDIALAGGIYENDVFNSFNVYPNPFSNSANVEFSLSQAGKISFDIYNVLGEKVSSIEEATYGAGAHSININAENLKQGVYYLNSVFEGQSFTHKLTIVK